MAVALSFGATHQLHGFAWSVLSAFLESSGVIEYITLWRPFFSGFSFVECAFASRERYHIYTGKTKVLFLLFGKAQ